MSSGGAATLRGVALDLDGTLLRSDHTISAATAQVCRQLTATGIWLTVASARPPESVRRFGEFLQSAGPWIALNGAVVFAPDRRIIHRCALPGTVLSDILDRYRNRGDVSVNVYSAFDWLVMRDDPRIDAEAAIVGFRPSLLAGDDTLPVADKVLLIADPAALDEVRRELARHGDQINMALSKASYLEITGRGADKGAALAIAATHAGISLDSVLAAGDGDNDAPMLSVCGFPVAMAHSPSAVKKLARHVVGSNDDDSLARFLAGLFAGRTMPG